MVVLSRVNFKKFILVILGYDLGRLNHKLVINEKEAELVREIFDLYLKEKSLLSVAMILNEKDYKTKEYTSKTGRIFGGITFKKTNIQLMIKNPLYMGKVRSGAELYPGMHEAIISDEVFNSAQEIRANNRRERENPKNTKDTGLLNHILRCRACDSIMFHTYARKGNHKYRYYVCMNAQKRGYKLCPTRSVNAQAMEEAVIEQLKNIANDDKELAKILESINKDPEKLPISKKELKDALLVTSPIWDVLLFAQKHRALRLLLKEASYDARDDKLNLTLNENGIRFLVLLGEQSNTKDKTKCNSNSKSI